MFGNQKNGFQTKKEYIIVIIADTILEHKNFEFMLTNTY